MTTARPGRFRRWLARLFKPRRQQEDWLETYNEQVAPGNDELLDLNQPRR